MKTTLLLPFLLSSFILEAQNLPDYHMYFPEQGSTEHALDFRGTTYLLDSTYTGDPAPIGGFLEIFERAYYSYDADCFLTQRLRQSFNPVLDEFEDHRKMLFTNDPDGQPIEILQQEYLGNIVGWQNLSRQNLTYNAQGLVDALIFDNWDEVNETWENTFFILFEYELDPAGNILQQTDYFEENGEFAPYFRSTFEYNGDKVLQMIGEYRFDYQWIPSIKEEYIYQNPYEYQKTTYYWDSDSESFLTVFRNSYTINSANGELAFELEETFDQNTQNWSVQHGIQYSWSEKTTTSGLSIPETIDFCQFPNPIAPGGTIYCQLAENTQTIMQLVDLNGRVIAQQDNPSTFRIPHEIHAGMYLLLYLEENKPVARQRLIVTD